MELTNRRIRFNMADVGSSPGTGAGEQLLDRAIVDAIMRVECCSTSSRTESADCLVAWSSDGPPYFSETDSSHTSRLTRVDDVALAGENKKQKITVPGLNGSTIDPEEPCDSCMAMCQYPDPLGKYRHLVGSRTSWLIPFATYTHTLKRGLSFAKPVKLVSTYLEAYDRAIYYYPDEIERSEQWQRYLELEAAGAAEDADMYRLRLMETTPMMLPPYKGENLRGKAKITEEARYQTLFTDEFWTDETRQAFVLIAALPDGFNQNKYEAHSRELFQQLYTKNRASAMKVDGGGGAGDDKLVFSIKRPLEPSVDYAKLNHAQLVTLLKEETASKDAMQQELNNYAQAKRMNDQSLESISQECTRLVNESDLAKDQLKQCDSKHKKDVEEAKGKLTGLQTVYDALKSKVNKQIDQNDSVVKKRDEFRGLLTKSQQNRKTEQESAMVLQAELDEANETITQLRGQIEESSMIDDRQGSPHFSGLSKSMTFSDMKPAKPENITKVKPVPESVPESPDGSVPNPQFPVDHEKEHNLGEQMKKGMMEQYRSAGGSVLTPYFYNGNQLELPALLLAMEDVHTRFRDHINAWTDGRIEGALSFHDHVEGLQLLDRSWKGLHEDVHLLLWSSLPRVKLWKVWSVSRNYGSQAWCQERGYFD